MSIEVSVVVPAHNSDPGRLARTLAGLRDQNFVPKRWELILVDNASQPALDTEWCTKAGGPNLRLVHEPELGLSCARRRGFTEARAAIVVLVDDDNVLAPDYLQHAVRLFDLHPEAGAMGGRSLPEFEIPPPAWLGEFLPLLALRDLGEQDLTAPGFASGGAIPKAYPICAPIGAGMALRRVAIEPWLEQGGGVRIQDRRGGELSSGGDNDIVFTVLEHGWQVGYFPELQLTHLIPAGRLAPAYLARLNRGVQRSWMEVLSRHGANPWPPIAPWTLSLRQLKAWFTHRAWAGPAAHIRWQGACGHFEGRLSPP